MHSSSLAPLLDKDDLSAGYFPTSNLGTLRSMVQARTLLQIQDTLVQWLRLPPKLQQAKSRDEDLGSNRIGTKRLLGGDMADGGSDSGRGTWSGGKDNKAANLTKKKTDRHPLFAELMRPNKASGPPLNVGKICRAAGLDRLKFLGR